ncbi:MAG: RidA family protein [Candidatus Eremiobacteraeota bacterium]|nr:RidA family protein [Candidatus Eremiobacteraeota bacterium]
MSRILQPPGWVRPTGYSHGIAAEGRYIAIAGQIGWNEREEFVSDDFVDQAAQALRNIVAILAEAGARPSDLIRLTWYVRDKNDFRGAAERLGAVYREIIGPHYPAMTLLQAALLEDRAKVEIEATAVVA